MKQLIQSRPSIKNRGFVLPVALILLLVSTLLGVTALRVNSLSEKMAVNALQREEAFARAEAALLEGELLVRDNASAIAAAIVANPDADNCAAAFNGSNGLCSPASHPQNTVATPAAIERWETIFFGTSISSNVRTTPDGTRYIIEFMGHVSAVDADGDHDTSCAAVQETWPYCEFDPFQFRITALATSRLNEANTGLVMLQSVYVSLANPIP